MSNIDSPKETSDRMDDDNSINPSLEDIEEYLTPENVASTSALLKSSFLLYVKFFYRFISREDFQIKKFHHRIIRRLEEFVLGSPKKKNLGICLPPRSGKSQLMILWASWCFAIEPRCNFIYTCYEETITNKMSNDIQNIINSYPYQLLFGVKFNKNATAKCFWETKQGGGFRAGPLHSAITGFGAGGGGKKFKGAFIIDDPLNAKFYNSDAEKRKVDDVYQTVIKKRLNNPDRTPIVMIMQRLAVDDLVAYVQQNEGEDWEFEIVKALDESTNPPTSFWEERFPVERLLKEKKQSPAIFEAQMQQHPVVLGGELVKESWFKFYSTKQSYRYRRVFFTADTAFKANEWNDFTAIGLWAMTDKHELHLIDLLHERIEAVDLLRKAMAFKNKWAGGVNGLRSNVFYIEDRASGMELIQRMRREGGFSVIPVRDRGYDKSTRWANYLLPYLEAGTIMFPDSAQNPISREVINELTMLQADMHHKHDDIADMIAQAGEMAFSSGGLF